MHSSNEWSQLKEVIVGNATNAKMPAIDKSVRTVNYADTNNVSQDTPIAYPQQVIDEANEDLKILSDFLQSEGVIVQRPDTTDCEYYNYCPRDSVLVHNDTSYATPMPIRCRQTEFKAFEQHLQNLHVIPTYQKDNLYNTECIGNPEILALTEVAPSFDAANILRANNEILYLVSNSGNRQGARLLQELLGNNVNVRLLENVYSYMHIDSTVAFLKEGLLLANPERIKTAGDLPKPFCDWEIIWAPEPTDIGCYPEICNASRWINMNLLSVNENLVVLEEHQHNLRHILKQKGIDCAMLPMRHQRTLGGGFHCVTLDTERT